MTNNEATNVKSLIKKYGEPIFYLILGGLISAGALNIDKIKEIISKAEVKTAEVSQSAYTE